MPIDEAVKRFEDSGCGEKEIPRLELGRAEGVYGEAKPQRGKEESETPELKTGCWEEKIFCKNLAWVRFFVN